MPLLLFACIFLIIVAIFEVRNFILILSQIIRKHVKICTLIATINIDRLVWVEWDSLIIEEEIIWVSLYWLLLMIVLNLSKVLLLMTSYTTQPIVISQHNRWIFSKRILMIIALQESVIRFVDIYIFLSWFLFTSRLHFVSTIVTTV